MKKLFVVLVLAGIAGLVWFFFSRSKPPESADRTTPSFSTLNTSSTPSHPAAQPVWSNAAPSNAASAAPATANSPTIARPTPAPLPPVTPYQLGSPDHPPAMAPETVLSNMRIVIQAYGSRFGGNPVGTNPEITRALIGENPKEVRFITEESGLRINGRGELVDYWGTPFFFHQLSGTEMEIHSAGPDKIMWTADDLVTK